MGLKRTKLLGIQAVTGINTVGILTVGVTPTAGGVGIASTTYLRGVVMHNTGLGTATSSLYVYPSGESNITVGQTAYRLARVDIASNETFFFEMNYPLVLTNQSPMHGSDKFRNYFHPLHPIAFVTTPSCVVAHTILNSVNNVLGWKIRNDISGFR